MKSNTTTASHDQESPDLKARDVTSCDDAFPYSLLEKM
jgi:hypothetical protein